MKNDKVEIMSVSEACLLFGIWKNEQKGLKGKKIVVVNRRSNKVVGAFQFIPIPIKVKEKCSYCYGTGKVKIKIDDL